jgi:hypothetical protein
MLELPITSGSKKRGVLIGTGMVLRDLNHVPSPPCGAALSVRIALMPVDWFLGRNWQPGAA